MLSVIKLCFKHLNAPTLVRLYKAFVRPCLEYCSAAWCPYYVADINVLEKVQRRMTRLIPHLRQMTYEERLSHLQLTTLKLRRLRYDLICAYNILNSFVDLKSEVFFTRRSATSFPRTVSTRGCEEKLFVRYSRLELRKSFFSQRVVPLWNSLPSSCTKANDPRSFKRELDIFLSQNNGFPTPTL